MQSETSDHTIEALFITSDISSQRPTHKYQRALRHKMARTHIHGSILEQDTRLLLDVTYISLVSFLSYEAFLLQVFTFFYFILFFLTWLPFSPDTERRRPSTRLSWKLCIKICSSVTAVPPEPLPPEPFSRPLPLPPPPPPAVNPVPPTLAPRPRFTSVQLFGRVDPQLDAGAPVAKLVPVRLPLVGDRDFACGGLADWTGAGDA